MWRWRKKFSFLGWFVTFPNWHPADIQMCVCTNFSPPPPTDLLCLTTSNRRFYVNYAGNSTSNINTIHLDMGRESERTEHKLKTNFEWNLKKFVLHSNIWKNSIGDGNSYCLFIDKKDQILHINLSKS